MMRLLLTLLVFSWAGLALSAPPALPMNPMVPGQATVRAKAPPGTPRVVPRTQAKPAPQSAAERAAIAEAETIKGEADAEAVKVYAESFGKDESFYRFWRSLMAYRQALPEKAELIGATDTAFFDAMRGTRPQDGQGPGHGLPGLNLPPAVPPPAAAGELLSD